MIEPNAISARGDMTFETYASGTFQAGTRTVFDVTGEADMAYSATIPATALAIEDGRGNSLDVIAWDFANGMAARSIDDRGTTSFAVEARLWITSGQTPGTYTGIFPVSVSYD